MSLEQISWFDNTVSRQLLAIPGVGEVNRSGGGRSAWSSIPTA
jgi:hypothetical protein